MYGMYSASDCDYPGALTNLLDGAGILADNAVLAVLSVTLGAGMKKRTLPPFYFVLARWNENAPPSQFISTTTTRTHNAPDDIRKPPSVSVIRQDSRWWFLQFIGYMLLSVPVMSFLMVSCGFVNYRPTRKQRLIGIGSLHPGKHWHTISWRASLFIST
ncbi:unnamed protein product [Absidia cylindrospora]